MSAFVTGNHKRSILVLDDNRAIRLIVRAYLGAAHEYLEAETGEGALEIIEQRLPHLIITDINMPGIGGLEFLRRIRGHARKTVSAIPLIVLTSEDLRETCLAAGATEFVRKPIGPTEFKAVIDKCLANLIHLRPSGEHLREPRGGSR